MKTLTCKELGGECDQQLSAKTWDAIVQSMFKHVMANHPGVAKRMEHMHNADPEQWSRENKPKWEAAPQS